MYSIDTCLVYTQILWKKEQAFACGSSDQAAEKLEYLKIFLTSMYECVSHCGASFALGNTVYAPS